MLRTATLTRQSSHRADRGSADAGRCRPRRPRFRRPQPAAERSRPRWRASHPEDCTEPGLPHEGKRFGCRISNSPPRSSTSPWQKATSCGTPMTVRTRHRSPSRNRSRRHRLQKPRPQTNRSYGRKVRRRISRYRTGATHLASIHGAPDARIVNSSPGQPDRVSTSDSVDATFLPAGRHRFRDADRATSSTPKAHEPAKRMQAWANVGALYSR